MNENQLYVQKMTPVRIIEDGDSVRVVFLQSARFYVLAHALPDFDALLATLREAVENNEAVEVSTESIESDSIKNIKRTR